jgi:nuclease HARBI1
MCRFHSMQQRQIDSNRKEHNIIQINKSKTVFFCKQIKDDLEPETLRSQPISSMNQLLIALRFYATGSFQLVVGDTFAVDKATVCRILHRVTRAIANLRQKYVKFPDSHQDYHAVMEGFYIKSGLPGVVGAIDCTHVPIQSPGGNDSEIYRNRKSYFSINVQLVCDTTNYITDVVARWPGSVHDSTIFDNSHVRAMFEAQDVTGYLVGDGGYASRRYMLTPISNPSQPAEVKYNKAQAAARNCIERTNGILKRRFPCLKYGMRLRLDNVLPVIVTTVVLHNIAVLTRDEEPENDEQLEEFIQMKRARGDQVDYDAVEVQLPTGPVPAGANGMRRAIIENFFA